MKVAIVSDVHGNLVALEAVLADLERVRPDLVVHGGDLAFNGPRPAECVDRIRDLGWPGVIGNMDRALETHRQEPRVGWAAERLGPERNTWLQALPMEWRDGDDVERSVAEVLASDMPRADLVASLYRHARWPG